MPRKGSWNSKLLVIPKPVIPPSVGAGPASAGTSSLADPLSWDLRRHQRHICIYTHEDSSVKARIPVTLLNVYLCATRESTDFVQ